MTAQKKQNPVRFDKNGKAYILCGKQKVYINYLDKEGREIKPEKGAENA